MIKTFRFAVLRIMLAILGLLALTANAQTQVGSGKTYTTLKAAFDAINAGTLTGNVVLQITSSTTETATAVLNASGTGSASYTSVNIYPTGTGCTITGSLNAPLIDLNGADNVTIDGRVNATGITKDLTISNTNTGTSAYTIRFRESAESNTVKYCTIKGSETSSTGGIIFFSTATAGNGNGGNTINSNNITNAADANRPFNAIYSLGTAGHENSGNTISNNNIYNFFNASNASNGISLSTGTTSWTISGNSFYETASFTATAAVAYLVININNTSGNGFTVSGNYIGGSSAACSGIWTKTGSTNTFYGINVSVGTSSASNIQGNTIANFSWSNATASTWYGMYVAAGNVNIGTSTGNTIGATSGTSSIYYYAGGNGNLYGIYIASTGTVDCEYNGIGSIKTEDANNMVCSIVGIYKSGSGTTTISNNTIGSNSTANSIWASQPSGSMNANNVVQGIYSAGTGSVTIGGNTIANLNNDQSAYKTFVLCVNGIVCTNGSNTITNNTVHDLTTRNGNTNTNDQSSIVGIALTGTANPNTVAGNTIYNLINTMPSGNYTISIIGLYFTGNSGTNVVSGNFIYGFSFTSVATALMYGIKMNAGSTTLSNNIISLGGGSKCSICGIYLPGASGNAANLYFNTVYLSGSPQAAGNDSYALYCAGNSGTRDIRNNIFYNGRTTHGTHYAVYFAATGGALTIDYNDYYATEGILGYYGNQLLSILLWRVATLQDLHSISVDPQFANAGGTVATNYRTSATLNGVSGTGITVDYSGASRGTIPKQGAFDGIVQVWKGTYSTNFGYALNWSNGAVPENGAPIVFDTNPSRDCYLDVDRTVGDITNSQSTYKLVANGHKLTVNGNLTLTNGAQIDATAASSEVVFAGTTAQSILSGAFVSNSVVSLTLNNSNGLILNGDLAVSNTLTLTAGVLTVGAATLTLSGNSLLQTSGSINASGSSATLAFTNSSAITLPASIFTGAVNNLTVNGTGGITASNDMTVNGVLNLQASNPSATKGSLDMGTYTLTMGASAANTGDGDVTGIIKRTSFQPNVGYTFGHMYTVMGIGAGGVMPTQVTFKVAIGGAPSWKSGMVKRSYEITQQNGSNTQAMILLHYLDSELNGNTESKLATFDYHAGIRTDEHGKASQDSTANWVSISNRNITYFNGQPWSLANSASPNFIWQGMQDTDWNNNNNWSQNTPPDATSNVIIPDASTTGNSPTLPATASIKAITIQSGGIVNGGSSTTLTVTGGAGAWNCSGTFNPGTSTVVFNQANAAVTGDATIGGSTTFYNVTVASGASVAIQQNNYMGIAGMLALNGTAILRAAYIPNTIEYNGTAQAVVSPNGSTPGFYNLILSGSGIKTMPSAALNIYGNFSMTGSASTASAANLNIGGNFTIGSNTTFNAGNYGYSIKGNFTNNGTFQEEGSDVTFNGTSVQTITRTTAFDNLTINNASGVIASNDITVNGVLNLQSANPSDTEGSLDMGSYTLTMGASATTVGIGDVSGIVKRTSFVPNVEYSFGSPSTSMILSTGGTMPTDVSVKVGVGGTFSPYCPIVHRTYDIIRTGGDNTRVTLKLHYLDDELNSNTESKLVVWDYHKDVTPAVTEEHGKASQNTVDDWVAISNRNITYFATAFDQHLWGVGDKLSADFTWQGLSSDDWNDVNNWSGGIIPSDTSDVVIPDAAITLHSPVFPSSPSAVARKIRIEYGGVLNGGTGTTLTITGSSGAWYNSGRLNPGTGTVTFTNANATVADSTSFYSVNVADGASLTPEQNNIMRISGTLSLTGSGVLRAAMLPNTIEYNGSNQTVINPNGLTPGYWNLALSGSGTQSMPASSLDVYGDFSMSGTAAATAGAALNVEGNFTIGSNAAFNTGTYSHTIAGNFSNSGTFTGTGSTVTFDGSSAQIVAGTGTNTFGNLTLSSSGAKSITASNLNVGGNFSTSGTASATAGVALNVNGNFSIGSGTSFSAGAFNHTLAGAFSNSGTFTSGSGTFTFDGSLAQTIGGTSSTAFSSLTLNNAVGVTASLDFTVNGVLNLQGANPSATKGCLDLWDGSNMKTLTMGALATTVGVGDVTGIVRRTSFVAGTSYSFGNQYTAIHFQNTGTFPTEIDCKISIGTAPSWKTGAVKRLYDFVQTGGSNSIATISTHYLDSELNGNDETKLVQWTNGTGGQAPNGLYEWGCTSHNATNNWVEIANVNIAYFPTSYGLLENTLSNTEIAGRTWSGSINTDWTNINNWNPVGAISTTSNVIIPDAGTTNNDPTLPAAAEIATLSIQANGILNAGTGSQLTVNGATGAWHNDGGTFNAGNSNVIFTNAAATISGTTNFYDLTISSGATLLMAEGGTIRIGGTVTNNGIWQTVASGGTVVEYNGGNQTVVVPNPATNRYTTLILSGSGTKTMPSSALHIYGDFTMSGTAATTVADALNVDGNFTIGSGASFTAGAYSHSIGGNFSNSGSFTGTGSTITFNGSSAQTINSGEEETFNNVTVDNPVGVKLTSNPLTTISGTLTINSGKVFEVASGKQLSVTGSISNSGGAAGFVLHSDASGTASLLHTTSNVLGTVERYIPGDKEAWHFLAPPVSNQDICGSWLPSGSYGNGTGYDLYIWYEPTSCWIYYLNTISPTVNWNTIHPESNFVAGRGYLYATQALNPTKAFLGYLNSGSVSASLNFSSTNGTLKGFNFVGNPYPSPIDWYALSGWSRAALAASGDGYDMWVWNPAVSNYGVYNSADADGVGTNSVTRYIASTQGFFVRSASTGTLAMDNSVRVHDNAGNLFKDQLQKRNSVNLRIKSENGFGADEVMLRFGFSANDDGAMKLFSRVPTAPSLFMSNKSNCYSVRYFTSTSDNSSVPILFTAGACGSYTISSSYDMSQFGILLLEDKQLKRVHDLRTGPYRFTATKSDPANRFVLHFEPIQPTPPVVDMNPIVYAKNEQLVVDLSAIHQETTVYVYDLMGRQMFQGKLKGENLHRLSLNSPQQVLVVKLVNTEKSYSQKVMWVRE